MCIHMYIYIFGCIFIYIYIYIYTHKYVFDGRCAGQVGPIVLWHMNHFVLAWFLPLAFRASGRHIQLEHRAASSMVPERCFLFNWFLFSWVGLIWHKLFCLGMISSTGISSSWRLFDCYQANTTFSWVSFRLIKSHLTYVLYLYTWSVRRCVRWSLSEYVTFMGLFSINQVSRNIHSVHIHSERQAACLMVIERICLFYKSLFSYADLFWHAFCACALGAVGDVPREYVSFMRLCLVTFGLFWRTSYMYRHSERVAVFSRITEFICFLYGSFFTYIWSILTYMSYVHSRRRSDLKHLDLQILRNHKLFEVTGTLFTHVKTCLKFWGLPRKRVWYVRGLLWNLLEILAVVMI